MSLVVTGLSHHTSDVKLRERLHFPSTEVPGALLALRKRLPGCASVVLSTCNRVEVYVHHEQATPEIQREITTFLSDWHNIPETEFRDALYSYTGGEAAGHLFRVAASVDSLVVGEQQILGQVHDAFLWSQAEQTTDKVIERLFQKAFKVAKDVRTQTNIGEGKVSISSVAVDLAVSIFSELRGKTVLVLGSGKMGELTLKSLLDHGVTKLLMVNRSIEKAEELAAKFNGRAYSLNKLSSHLHEADIVLTSTGADEYVLTPEHFEVALKQRNNRPMFVIDIAVPRDVDPNVNGIDEVFLYDMDSLQEAADANLAARRGEIANAMVIINDGVDGFTKWLNSLAAEPTIVSMVEEMNTIREAELAKTLKNLPELTDADREEIEYLTKRIVNKILQRPMRQLKEEVHSEDDPHTVLHLVKRLFGLKESS